MTIVRKTALLLTIFLGFTVSLQADVLTFKNGDVLTGTWERVHSGNLVFKSDSIGEITVPAAKIKSFVTAAPATALLPNGSSIDGTLEFTAGGKWQIVPQNTQPVESFVAIYPTKSFQTLEKSIHPKLYQNWKGAANLGYSLITGDTQSRSLTSTVNATRNQPDFEGLATQWRTTFFLTTLFSHAKSDTSPAVVTSNTFSSGIRQDRLFNADNFVFAMAQYDYIQPQGIKLRQTYGAGFGRDVIHKPNLTFSLLGGMTFVRTDFEVGPPPFENSAEPLIGEAITAKLTKFLNLQHDLNFYPNLTQTGQYRFDTSTTLAVPISKLLSFSVSYVDFYLSNPQPGSHQNNATFSTGLGVNF
jgi:putative salt-induced outer membrane protein YdiY